MRVLVTGNLGFIGPVIVRRLREAGHYVIGVDTGWYVGNYAGEPVWPDVQHFGDIRKPRDSWFIGVDAAVHLAGLSNDPIGDLDQSLTNEINFMGTAGMLVPGARNLVVSSCSVYGTSDGEPSTEASGANPLTAYARAKLAVDNYLLNFGDTLRLDWVSLRLGTVWGYSPGHRLDLVVNRFAYDAAWLGRLTAKGNARRPIVHVEDVADAVLHFLAGGDSGIYNIVGENVQVVPLAEKVAAVAGDMFEMYVPIDKKPADSDQRDYMATGAKAFAAGWAPQYRLDDSLPDLLTLSGALPRDRTYERLPIARKYLETVTA